MSGVLVIERIVLESLEKRGKELFELVKDTKLDQNLLKNVLSHLINKGIIKRQDKGVFVLNNETKSRWLSEINNRSSVGHELKELFSSLVNNFFKEEVKKRTNLNMKKVYLTSKERDALDQKFKEIDQFLAQIAIERQRLPLKEITADKQVLFWGRSIYKDLVDEQLEAV
jgi:predicted transcriptional regulator